MRFAITGDHREFFNKNRYIEFEGMLTGDQIASLKKAIDATLAKRLRISQEKIKDKTAPEIYRAGYDLWRDSEEIKKTTHKNSFALLASELTQLIPIRYGFDQYFATIQCSAGTPYDVPMTLQDISCLSPLAAGLILPLADLPSPPTFFPMPLKTGNGLFISPHFSLPWPQLFSTCGFYFLLIGYATEKTLYRPNSHDPHSAALKKLGYAYNEQLNDTLHPIVHRKK